MILFCIVSLIVIGNYGTESAYIDFLCPDPEPIVNGSHNGDCIGSFPPGVNVTYACDYGYGMEGPKSRICRIIEPSDPYSRPIARWEPQEPPVCKRLIPCRVFCFGHAECFIKDGKMACACQPGSFWTPMFNSCQVDSEIYCHIIFSAKPYVKEIVDNVIETLQKKGIEQAVLELVSHRKGISRCFSTKEKKENTAEIDKVVKV
uniref:complement receptor type 2-like n=1 Tax=Styela clava TaxID=7725 RepID=UPI00193960D3|nr:complement receptor type 2-like [Styela clava]